MPIFMQTILRYGFVVLECPWKIELDIVFLVRGRLDRHFRILS